MENISAILKKLKKHHFWIICGLVTVVGLTAWVIALGRLSEEEEAQKAQISQRFQMMSDLSRKANHPNPEHFHEPQKQLNAEAALAIEQAWQMRFERQVGLLTWPTELGPEWISRVQGLRPIEEHVKWEDRNDSSILWRQHRAQYRDFIQAELPQLAETIGAVWQPDMAAASERTGVAPPPAAGASAVVLWDPADQQRVVKEHFEWSDLPTTLHVLYAQEDLWVLEALMQIIAQTNGEDAVAHKAIIREIHEISIGKSAGELVATIIEPVGAMEDSIAGGEAGMSVGMPRLPSAPSAPRPSGEQRQARRVAGDPAEGRYVDRNYQPLSAEQLRASISSDSPQDAYLAVAKRMPIRMRLTMDQRRINRLLIACANSPLTVEVRKVHLIAQSFPSDPGAEGGAGQWTGQPGLFPRPGLGVLPIPSRPGGPGSQASGGALRVYDADVEIYGIIYIYNDVNTEKLNIDAEELQQQGYLSDVTASTGAP